MEDEDPALLATSAPCHALIALASEVDGPYLDSLEEIEIKLGLREKPIPKVHVEEIVKPIVKNLVGRNELCPCGSGKKYKKCCVGKDL